ncbi:MAG: peroxiredoxin family protein [Candidatus Binatia bacterium]
MSSVSVGQPAPSFRLPSGQGSEIGNEDYRGKKNTIVWFTKGFSCPFCRQHMSQLARGYSRFRDLDTELLEIAVTTPPRARSYLQKFQLPYPYLCDPDYDVRKRWGLGVRSHSLLWYAKSIYQGFSAPTPENDFGSFGPPIPEMPRTLADDDAGFFIVDKGGTVRFAQSGAYAGAEGVQPIPNNDQIVRELEKLRG